MVFKETRLYELLRWMGAAAMGVTLFIGCVLLLQEVVFTPLMLIGLLLLVSSVFVSNLTVKLFLSEGIEEIDEL